MDEDDLITGFVESHPNAADEEVMYYVLMMMAGKEGRPIVYWERRAGWQRGFLGWVWSSPKLRLIDKAVYTILCIFANNDTQQAFPTTPQIGKMLGKSRSVLYPHAISDEKKEDGALERLEDLGYIRISKFWYRGKYQNKYTLLDRPEFYDKWDTSVLADWPYGGDDGR